MKKLVYGMVTTESLVSTKSKSIKISMLLIDVFIDFNFITIL